MLSSLVSSNANSQGANSRNSSATAASVFPASADATEQSANATNVSLDGRAAQNASMIAQELAGDLFADQLDDALVDTVQLNTEVLTPEKLEEKASASAQTPAEPNAEEWLLAMLDQQQLQLHARDAVVSAAAVAGSAAITTTATTTTSADAASAENPSQPLLQKVLETVVDTNVPASLSTESSQASGNNEKISADAESVSKSSKTLESGDAVAGVFVANTKSKRDDVLVSGTTSLNAAPNISMSVDEKSESSSPLNSSAFFKSSSLMLGVSPTVVSGSDAAQAGPIPLANVSAESVQRSVQSQLTLHAPEAKWGEQLLHTLRDNVQVQIQQKIQNATIRLDPPELGSLEIYLSHESGRLTVNITASQADVARLIQTTSDRLRQELAGPQFTHVNVQTSADGQNGQQQSRERQRSFGDEQILANDQSFTSHQQQANHSGDVLVTV